MAFNISQYFLSNPYIYSTTMRLLGTNEIIRMFVETYIRPKPGDKIMDIGCGPADILNFLPEVEYYGFDIDAGYIEAAKKRFGKKGIFVCQKIRKDAVDENSRFDLILAKGVLHHLNDAEAADMFDLARTHLKKGGRLITYDGCYEPGQNYFAKMFLSMDRGKYVRTKETYLTLASQSFSNITPIIRHDLLKIPYTILILECTK
jgi:SAM-dependent methyltransferase